MTAALLLSVVCCLHQPSPAQAPNFAEFPFERLCLECSSSSSSGGGHSYVVARVSAISSAPPTSNRHQHQPSTATGDSSQDPDQRHVSCVMQICRGRVTCCSRASRVIYDPAVCCSQAAVAPQPSRDATRAAAPCSTAAGSVVNIDFCRQFTRPPRCWPRTRRRAARWKWRK